MKAKKLPSGSWRCQVCKNGIRKSFVVKDPTINGKRKCENMAAKWLTENDVPVEGTVYDCIKEYIDFRKDAVSPTTNVGYKSLLDHAYEDIKDLPLSDLTNDVCQKWLDKRAKDHKAKSLRNAFGLLNAAYHHKASVRLSVRFPDSVDKDYVTPTDKDVQRLLDAVRGTDMEKAVLLSAFGTLREGEVAALRKEDIKGDTITVRHSYGWDGEKFVLKSPKTASSVRTITLPHEVIKRLKPSEDGRIVPMDPRQISHRFAKIKKRIGVDFRFHDLRAYSASIRHALNIPDAFIQADGGWKTPTVLNKIYRRAMSDKRKQFADIANKHFSSLLSETVSHDFSHDTQEVQ